ncbi:MAG: quinolinate synthase NadA [Proteobacteria bacterium]|nr:quinolinate synthase NadA [Pseudomonadota bacterium]
MAVSGAVAWEAALVERLARVMPEAEARAYLPLVADIQALKRQHRAVVVAHNYQVPAITAGIADFTGDSLAMARYAARADADTIVVCGVRFMAETAKVLNYGRRVLAPAPEAGCSLADAITAADVRRLREQYPGVPVVAYVNTTAEVKAEVDACCTSGNAVEVVRALGSPRVILVPDRYLAAFVAARVDCEVITWPGACEVHERFTAADIRPFRERGVCVMAHPECPPEVQTAADFVGSTAAMIGYLEARRPERVLLLTECSMADNITVAHPELKFERPCNLCRHMKQVTLESVRDALRDLAPCVEIGPDTARRARAPLERMLAA